MSSLQTDQAVHREPAHGSSPSQRPTRLGVRDAWRTLAVLSLLHFFVDFFASFVSPLWPAFESHYALEAGAVFWLFGAWVMTTSFGQLFVALAADRFSCSWLIAVAPAVAVVCICCIGLAALPWIGAILLACGGLAVAAFHPEGAALAGAASTASRSRAMSIFALGGYLGQAVGPTVSGSINKFWGVGALAWCIPAGLAMVIPLAFWMRPRRAGRSGSSERGSAPRDTTKPSVPIHRLLRGRWPIVLLMIATGMCRVIPIMGAPVALAFLIDARSGDSSQIGFVQSAFLLGLGVGGIACAAAMRPQFERLALWLLPIAAAPLLLPMGFAQGVLLLALVVATGLLLGVTLPVLISYGQQLLPEGQRVASSLTMGVTWGVGGALVSGLMAVLKHWQVVETAFVFYAASALLAGMIAFCLPKLALHPD